MYNVMLQGQTVCHKWCWNLWTQLALKINWLRKKILCCCICIFTVAPPFSIGFWTNPYLYSGILVIANEHIKAKQIFDSIESAAWTFLKTLYKNMLKLVFTYVASCVQVLIYVHNVHIYLQIFEDIKKSIQEETFCTWKKELETFWK